MIRNKIGIGVVIVTVIISVSGLYQLKKHPRYYNRIKDYINRIIYYDSNSSSNTFYVTRVKNDKYSNHRKEGSKNGVFVKDNKELEYLIKQKKLVEISDSKGFKISKLYFSSPYLTKYSSDILKDIGKTFHSKTNGKYFVVTSLTRSVESQNKLSKTNINATKNGSSHCYGVSFDISYIKFNGKKKRDANLQSILENILIQYQNEKKIYLIIEKRQNCYHITQRK